MNKFGIKIDMSTFFQDERKMVFVMVDPTWANVECLQKRVEVLFDVDSVRFINSDGYFLPSQEPIELVRLCTGLKAFIPKEVKESLEKKKKKKSKKDKNKLQYSESEETASAKDDDDETKNKRKYYSLESSIPKAKRSKNHSSNNIEKHSDPIQFNKSSEISSTSEQMPPPPSSLSPPLPIKKSKVKKSLEMDNNTEDRIVPLETLPEEYSIEKDDESTSKQLESNDQKNQRSTSTPKQKKLSESIQSVERTLNRSEIARRPSGIPSSTFINESKMSESNKKSLLQSPGIRNPFKNNSSNKSKGHIYFDQSGEMISTISTTSSKSTPKKDKENMESHSKTIFRCSLNDVRNGSEKPRIFKISPKLNSPKKQLLHIQEEIILPPISIETDLNKTKNLDTIENNVTNSETMEIPQINKTDDSLNTTIAKSPKNSLKENLDKTDTENITIANKTDQTSADNNHTAQNDSINQTDKTNTINANDSDAKSRNTLEKSQTVEDPEIQDQSMSQTEAKPGLNESSVLSDDCVDVSIIIDDEEDANKHKKTLQSHDLTNEDRGDDSSDVEEISEIIDLNETEDNCDSTANTSLMSPCYSGANTSRLHKILPFCTDMKELPNVGDIAVFKVSYVNKNMKTVVTNYITGKAVYINKRIKSIKLIVTGGFKELSNVPNKYFCSLDDSQDDAKYLQIKLNEMVEPKVYSRS